MSAHLSSLCRCVAGSIDRQLQGYTGRSPGRLISAQQEGQGTVQAAVHQEAAGQASQTIRRGRQAVSAVLTLLYFNAAMVACHCAVLYYSTNSYLSCPQCYGLTLNHCCLMSDTCCNSFRCSMDREYYHATTLQPVLPHEMDNDDSDNEVEEEWVYDLADKVRCHASREHVLQPWLNTFCRC